MKYIPTSAKKVFTGVVFEVYQWRQKMFNNTHEIFEVVKRSDTVEVVGVTVGKKIIVLKQKQPHTKWYYSLPGGLVNQDESRRQGAQRELKEETGYQAGKLVLWKSIQPYSKMIYSINIFLAYDCLKNGGLNLDCGEKIEVQLLSFDQLLKLAENPLFMTTGYFRSTLIRALYSQKHRQALKKLFFKTL
ncbi:MAG: NUDIX hydrolase [Candidatus Komeilibacteria bacterium]|nr:NUDIX hydrolase [Candidatus Komeilibacteria bacterium]